jgi:hypothetical protein
MQERDMNEADTARSANATTPGAAEWLSLAAAPTFAMMALLTSVLGGSAAQMLCMSGSDTSWLTGMVPMYLLMSAFHSAAWLKLIFRNDTYNKENQS